MKFRRETARTTANVQASVSACGWGGGLPPAQFIDPTHRGNNKYRIFVGESNLHADVRVPYDEQVGIHTMRALVITVIYLFTNQLTSNPVRSRRVPNLHVNLVTRLLLL